MRKEARDIAEMSPFDYFAYSAGEAGGQVGRNLGGMLGMQTPEEAKQGKIEEIMGQYGEGAKTTEQLRDIAGDFGNAGMMDLMQETLSMIDASVGKTTATQRQNAADMDATLAFLESSKKEKLTPEEAAYFKSRIKKDVSVSMGGQVIDTAPNVFDQIIKARGGKTNDTGIGDTGVTEAGEEKKQLDLDKKVTSLSDDLNKVGGVEDALSQLERRISKYVDAKTGKLIGDIPGLSSWETWTRGAEGNAISALWENLIGEVRHERFGSVLTANEQKMFEKIKTGNPLYLPDTAVLEYIRNMRETVDNQKNKIRKGYAKDVVSEYDSRGLKANVTEEQSDLLSKYNLK